MLTSIEPPSARSLPVERSIAAGLARRAKDGAVKVNRVEADSREP